MPNTRLSVFSNIPELVEGAGAECAIEHRLLSETLGVISAIRDAWRVRNADFVVLMSDARRTMLMGLFLRLIPGRVRLVSVDCLLGLPVGRVGWIVSKFKGVLLRRVHRFICFQKDFRGLDTHFGIGHLCQYMPFKSNAWDALRAASIDIGDDGYFLQAGRTLRDIPLFIEACRRSEVPAVLLYQDEQTGTEHGTSWETDDLPMNVRRVLHDGNRDSFVSYIARARAVAIAINPNTITCTGISTALDALALGKCLIMTRGPATEGILEEQEAVLVEAGDFAAFADAMRKVNSDSDFRDSIAAAGQAASWRFQGKSRLHSDLRDELLRMAERRASSERPGN